MTQDQKEDVLKFCKSFVERHGSVRVGWAIQRVIGQGYTPPTHIKEKIANTIIQSGEYLKEKAAKKYDDWNIYRNPEYNKLSKIDKINLGLGVFSVVGVIISILISFWGVRSSENIAEKSGAFDKGLLQLSFGGYFINPNVDFDVYYGIDFADTNILHFATLPFSIHNLGKKTIDGANMLIKYPHIANIAVADTLIKFEAYSTDQIERKFVKVEPYDQVIFKLNSLNPNYSIDAGELICIQKETIFRGVFPVTTKDSSKINISTSVQYAYPIVVGLTAKDIISAQYNFSLNYRKSGDLNELISNVIQEKLSQKDKPKHLKNFFVIIPNQINLVGDDKVKIALMNSNSSNTLLCIFDETMTNVLVMNQDGTAQKIIKLTK